MTFVKDIVAIMEKIAPFRLAEDWDNTGLAVGSPDWPANHIMLALDPHKSIVEEAISRNADLLLTHHPLFFHPIKSVNPATPQGKIVQDALMNNLAIMSAHTNLDKAIDGVNQVLALRLGLENITQFGPLTRTPLVKFAMVVSKESVPKVMSILTEAGAGEVFIHEVATAVENSAEVTADQPKKWMKVETLCSRDIATKVKQAVEVACGGTAFLADTKLDSRNHRVFSLGRMGDLKKPMRLADFAGEVKKKLDISFVRYVGDPDLMVFRAALCSGSGSSLTGNFLSTDAQVFVTGDMGYHPACNISEAGKSCIDAGHFATEHLVLQELKRQLAGILEKRGQEARISLCQSESDPFCLA